MRRLFLLPALALVWLTAPAGAADRLTPQPVPTAAAIRATPAAPAADGRPLRPQAAFEPPPVVAPPPFAVPAASAVPSPESTAPSPVPPLVAAVPETMVPETTMKAAAPPHPVPIRKPPAPAAGAKRRVWATEDVYVRAAPDPRARIVDGLGAGDALDRLPGGGETGGWVRVGRDGRPLGFVAGRFLADAPPKPVRSRRECSLPDDLPDAPRRIAAPGTRMRALADAYMRAKPTCEARALDVLEAGATVTVTGHGDGWYEVRGQGWSRAYVSARLLAEAKGR